MIYTVEETVFCAILPFLSVGDWAIKSPDYFCDVNSEISYI